MEQSSHSYMSWVVSSMSPLLQMKHVKLSSSSGIWVSWEVMERRGRGGGEGEGEGVRVER